MYFLPEESNRVVSINPPLNPEAVSALTKISAQIGGQTVGWVAAFRSQEADL
jgi:hypothetical protein